MYGYLMNDKSWGIMADSKHEALALASEKLGREVKWKEMHRTNDILAIIESWGW